MSLKFLSKSLRNTIINWFIFLFISSSTWVCSAKILNIDITQASNNSIPIMLLPFADESLGVSAKSNDFIETIKQDLTYSGRFKVFANKRPLSTDEIIRRLSDPKNRSTFSAYDHVLVGKLLKVGDDNYTVSVELVDLYKSEDTLKKIASNELTNFKLSKANSGVKLFAKTFENISSDNFRALAHHLSNLIYSEVVGKAGIFSGKIAYVRKYNEIKKGWFNNTVKPKHSIVIADYDGKNPKEIVISDKPLMSPSFSPDGKSLAYVSFQNNRSGVYSLDISSGRSRLLTSFKGINGAPEFSPDGKRLALVLSKDGNPNLFLYNLSTGGLKKLTHGYTIDTEPHWSKDGKEIIFTSNRGGGPQLYRYLLDNNKIERITYTGSYNASGAYTYDGKSVIFMHRRDRDCHFQIAMQNLRNGEVTALTNNNLDVSPSVSPNGDMVVFSRKVGNKYELNLLAVTSKNSYKINTLSGSVESATWSPVF